MTVTMLGFGGLNILLRMVLYHQIEIWHPYDSAHLYKYLQRVPFTHTSRSGPGDPIVTVIMETKEVVEDIVIVGAGIAGLSTSLGLHRYLNLNLIIETIHVIIN